MNHRTTGTPAGTAAHLRRTASTRVRHGASRSALMVQRGRHTTTALATYRPGRWCWGSEQLPWAYRCAAYACRPRLPTFSHHPPLRASSWRRAGRGSRGSCVRQYVVHGIPSAARVRTAALADAASGAAVCWLPTGGRTRAPEPSNWYRRLRSVSSSCTNGNRDEGGRRRCAGGPGGRGRRVCRYGQRCHPCEGKTAAYG